MGIDLSSISLLKCTISGLHIAMINRTQNKHLTIINQHFYPEVAPTGQLMYELARDLIDRHEFQVEVLTGRFSYHNVSHGGDKSGLQGISIKRLWGTAFNGKGALSRILNYATFIGSLSLSLFSIRSPMVLVTTAPPFAALVTTTICKIRRIKTVFLVYDLYPEIAVQCGYLKPSSLAVALLSALNKITFSLASAVVVIGRDMRELISRKYNVVATRLHLLPTWSDKAIVQAIPKERNSFIAQHNLVDKAIIMYSGNLGVPHDHKAILGAAERLRMYSHIVFLLVGGGSGMARLKREANDKGLSNICFLPYQPLETLAHSLSAATISLISQRKEVVGTLVPSKLTGILAVGSPVISISSDEVEVARVIRDHDCGQVVPPGDGETLANAIVEMLNNTEHLHQMAERARNAFESHYERTHVTDSFAKMLQMSP